MILERFSEVLGAKHGRQNRFLDHFLRCFFRMRFGIDFSSISGDSDLEKSTKTIVFSMVFVNFHKMHIFEKIAKKLGFWSGFGRLKLQKNEENMVWKSMFFLTSLFRGFFMFF